MDGLILPILILYFSTFLSFVLELKKLEYPPDLKPEIDDREVLISTNRWEE